MLAVLGLAGCAERYPVNGSRAMARVVEQLAFGPRIPGTPGHAAMVRWLDRELRALGADVERQVFTDSSLTPPVAITNLIARFGPTAGRRLLLAAHYDSRPRSDMDPDPAQRDMPLPGANDGGSGVAVLLEVAELIHRRPPRVGVDLVFFDAEDLGTTDRPQDYCLGARGYARRLPPPGSDRRPIAGFVFDMVGDRDLQIHPERNSVQRAANLVALVLEAARATGARGFEREPRWELIDDHVPLLDAGLPTVDIIDFDYPAWHTRRDTARPVVGPEPGRGRPRRRLDRVRQPPREALSALQRRGPRANPPLLLPRRADLHVGGPIL